MHVIDAVLDSFSNLFRFNRYSPVEKLYSIILFIAGLSLRDLSERLCLTCASRESVRIWVHRFSSPFRPFRRVRRLITVDESVMKVKGHICILRKVMDSCVGKPFIVVDRGPWYRWALERLELKYQYQRFGLRNRVERFDSFRIRCYV
jgi:transposase-like protein